MTADGKLPRQIAFIIGNEGCERFSFYGMKNILTQFLVQYLLLTKADAKSKYHLFVSAVYFFPLLGGFLADRYLGKYRTIFWLSILYCGGHACLALFEKEPMGFYVGLGLIALGAGGIKPCVSAFVGDQFDASNKHLAKHVFALFYWIINFGSFFASLLIPKTLAWWGGKVAFGIPGVLMAIATLVLWLGRRLYIDVPPTGKPKHSFFAVLLNIGGPHPPEAVDGVRAVLRVMLVFAPIPLFWALFDQKGSTWILQAMRMDLDAFGYHIEPSQLMALNPALVMILIPILSVVVYPALERAGRPITLLGRMRLGMFVAALAFASVGLIERRLEAGVPLSVLWQAVPYVLITIAEVLVATTGLEFAYSQAPAHLKSTVMSFWNLTVTVGNLLTAQVAALNVWKGAREFFFWSALMAVAASLFFVATRRYVMVDRYRSTV